MTASDQITPGLPGTFIGDPRGRPWTEVPDRAGRVRVKFMGEDRERGPWITLVSFDPGYSEPPHRHDFDTIYIPTRGTMSIGEEGRVGVGQVRWVRAGTFYGPEAAGDQGCEFWLIAYGPPGYHREPLPT